MRHLPRRRRALATQVNDTPAPVPTPVAAAPAPLCCGGFKAATVRVDGRLITVHCWECVPSPATAGVIDDIEAEDEADDYEDEPESLLIYGAVA
ncbi:hypothetical protein ACFV2X_49925 [Streptomyces sp. NPDC059679]|uniref:hypothetical protein n=1 Tax=Streptomyces sp. NPDC059679 TaxID=3346903 RepID=UPI0036A85B10